MLKNLRNIKLSLRSFLIYACCVALPLILITFNYTLSRIQQRRDDYNSSKHVVAAHLNQVILSQFDLIEKAANEIYLSSWYKKYISVSPVYRQEFNIVRQLEISGDLMHSVSLLPFADDILILNTRDQSVVCKFGWFGSMDKYSDVYCRMDLGQLQDSLKHRSLLSTIRSLDKRFFIISYPDSNRNSSCRIGILIRLSSFQTYLDSIHYNDDFSTISVILEEQLLLKHEVESSTNKDMKAISLSSIRPDFIMLFEYPSFDTLYQADNVMQLVLNSMMALAAGMILAFLLTNFFTVPLERLLLSISPFPYSSHRQAFDHLSSHINTITLRNQQLTREMDRFTAELRNQMLINLLTQEGSLTREHNTMDQIFPWLAANKPYFLIVEQGNADLSRIKLLTDQSALPDGSLIKLDLPLGYTGCLCIRNSEGQAQALAEQLCSHLPLAEGAFSQVHTGYSGLHACYREAVSQIDFHHNELSLANTLSMLNHLQLGDAARCRQALQPYTIIQDEDLLNQVLSLLDRWARENNLTLPGTDMNQEGKPLSWEAIVQRIDQLCQYMDHSKKSHCSSIIIAVNEYLAEYFYLPDISLKYLSDQFNISIGALSRMYKQETGRNFSVVLLELRMKKAKEMLVKTANSIASISLACGYENYISFKRAFIRIEGISPREYREVSLPSACVKEAAGAGITDPISDSASEGDAFLGRKQEGRGVN